MEKAEAVKLLEDLIIEQNNQKSRGLNNYNIMTAIRKANAEVGMHSNFIISLLDVDGEHYQGNLFVKLFIKHVLLIDDFGKSIKAKAEESTSKNRRIDFIIDSDDYFIGIEMKIDANDGKNQMYDYYRFLCEEKKKKVKMYYLTIDGKKASKESLKSPDCSKESLSEDDYNIISFKTHILNWLVACKEEVSNITNLNNAIGYYIEVVKQITSPKEDRSPIKSFEKLFLEKQNLYVFCDQKENFDFYKLDKNKQSIEAGFIKAKQKLYDNFYKKLLKDILKDDESLHYFRYIDHVTHPQIQLVLDKSYGINIFLNKNLDKLISIHINIAWAYNNEAKGNKQLHKALSELNYKLGEAQNIKKYFKNANQSIKGEKIDQNIPKSTIYNLFLKEEETIKWDIVILKEHIDSIKKVL